MLGYNLDALIKDLTEIESIRVDVSRHMRKEVPYGDWQFRIQGCRTRMSEEEGRRIVEEISGRVATAISWFLLQYASEAKRAFRVGDLSECLKQMNRLETCKGSPVSCQNAGNGEVDVVIHPEWVFRLEEGPMESHTSTIEDMLKSALNPLIKFKMRRVQETSFDEIIEAIRGEDDRE